MKRIQRVVRIGERSIEEDMTELWAARLAMLIDTDGCIYATKRNAGIRVGMCGIIPIMMSGMWGGRLHKRYNLRTKNFKYTWILVRRKLLRSFLIKIKPHLIQKRKQAELALKMCDILDKKPEGYKKRLEELKMKISKLNQARAPDIDITKLKGVY